MSTKIAVVNGKLLFTGRREIVDECRKRYENASGKWFMDIEKFRELDSILSRYGCKLKSAHPFYLPTELSEQGVRKDITDKTVDLMIKEDFNLVRYKGMRSCNSKEMTDGMKHFALMITLLMCWLWLLYQMVRLLVWLAQALTVTTSGRLV